MFTLKFYEHNNDSHEVFACQRYKVTEKRNPPGENECGETAFLEIRMFRTLEDDNPYYETVGSAEIFAHAFVVNDVGKTIDMLPPRSLR